MLAGHHGFAAEVGDSIVDPPIVRRDDDAQHALGQADALDNVLDERLAGAVGERLARKPRGAVAGGDDRDGG